MTEEQFIIKNKPSWENLERYNRLLSQKSLSSLDSRQVSELSLAYKSACHHLAFSKTHFKESKTSVYLNQVVSIAHNHFYIKEKTNFCKIIQYFTRSFADMVNENFKYVFASFLLFMFGAVLFSVLVFQNPRFINYFMEENSLTGAGGVSMESVTGQNLYLSTMVMTNNIRVCMLSIGTGILAGLGTIYVLFINGGMLGALWAYVSSVNQVDQLQFWGLILPHGFIELIAIFISGGAGLIIGESLLIPKDHSRIHSLINGAKKAGMFLPGIALMLLIAGMIEGFFTPLAIAPIVKIAFSFGTLVITLFYFIRRKLKRNTVEIK